MASKKRPPKPPTKFKVGDRCVPSDDLLSEHGTVTGVEQHWVGDEWREYIGGDLSYGTFGGNADLYEKVGASPKRSNG